MNIFSMIRRFWAWVFGDGDDSAAGVSHHQEPEEVEIKRFIAAPDLSDPVFIADLREMSRKWYAANGYPNGVKLEIDSDEPREDTD